MVMNQVRKVTDLEHYELRHRVEMAFEEHRLGRETGFVRKSISELVWNDPKASDAVIRRMARGRGINIDVSVIAMVRRSSLPVPGTK